jgi:deoxyribodipyrimidine photo-lyase
MPTTVWWIRRDLRLGDNQALAAAIARAGDETGAALVPLFIIDPAFATSRAHASAERRRDFLWAGLQALDEGLRARGSRLVIRRGDPTAVLATIAAETSITSVVAEADWSPYSRRRDAAVRRVVPLELVGGPTLRHPTDVVKADGTPYTVFGAFARAWLGAPIPTRTDLVPTPEKLPPVPDAVRGEPIPAAPAPAGFPAGEAEARRRLSVFTHGDAAPIDRYASERDRLDRDGTSTLSPYLRFGMVSAREAIVAASARGDSAGPGTWRTELVWREFYHAILYHVPRVLHEACDRRFQALAWRDAPDELRAWHEGRTGYPVVDAAMRQLAATGWMHNRARMIVASFLTKDLLIDWRAGEAWFMHMLVDGDPAANNGGWQWVAGVGTDAAPYFRIFNPILQGRKFDPAGDYVRRWVPELGRIPGPAVHEPWRLAPLEQQAAGCVVGRDYPERVVDHGVARARALEVYGRARARP